VGARVFVWICAIVMIGARAAAAHPAQDGKPCAACHDDKHHGEFAKLGDCGTCHTTTAFAPTTLDARKHAVTGYALDGKHAATPCAGCHPGPRPRISWQLFGTACLDCHENPHGTKYTREMTTDGCAHCHGAGGWGVAQAHPTWPLTGAHQQVTCAGCHGKHADGAPPAAFRGIPRTCDGCHDDSHAGQFRQTPPQRACDSCHTTASFAATAFDHAKTKYPLEGVHVKLACSECHATTELRDGDKVVRWRLGYSRCKDCHADPHGAKSDQRDCNACHNATTWSGIAGDKTFDHDRTGFPLRGAHVQPACDACHAPGRATVTACEGCHRDPHAGRTNGTCAECHTATAWSDTATLEQHRRTRMPLTGRHAVIACNACHTRADATRQYTDLPVDCYSCHRAEYHGDLHPDHDGDPNDSSIKPFSRDCALCHRTTAWQPAVADPSTVIDTDRRREHDAQFVISTGSHRAAECAACHVDPRRARSVRCDGCHQADSLRTAHRGQPVAASAAACLRCHPQGAKR
jgi:hypothetical protein